MSKIVGNPTVTPIAAYTKKKTESLLNKKADLSKIENMCKYKGSVDSFDDLPYEITFEVTGQPYMIVDGVRQDIGSYDTTTGVVSFSNVELPQGEYKILLPVDNKTIALGYYACGRIDFGNINGFGVVDDDFLFIEHYIGEYTGSKYIPCNSDIAFEQKEQDITVLTLFITNESESPIIVNGSGKITAFLSKVVYQGWMTPHEALLTGHIYKDNATDTHYVWTGTEWDALGGTIGGGEIDSSHINNTNNPHKVTASQTGAYTKGEVDDKLRDKADKSDISNVYKYVGSVETFDDLPIAYTLIPNGVPTINGEPCGSFENGKITIDETHLESDDEIIVPIERIELKPGYYYIDHLMHDDTMRSSAYVDVGGVNSYVLSMDCLPSYIGKTTIVDSIVIWNHNGGYIGGSTTTFGSLLKVDEAWFEEHQTPKIPYEIYEQGAVFNVIKGDMNYAWTGTDWDALGGISKDSEMQNEIDDLKNTKANKSEVYTKNEVNTELAKKANKEDVASAYKFMGSVSTFDDLPWRYALIPNGVPYVIENGVKREVGTFNKETGVATLTEDGVGAVRFPIIPIDVKADTPYFCDTTEFGEGYLIFEDDTEWFSTALCNDAHGHSFAYTSTDNKVTAVLPISYYEGMESDNMGVLYKALDSWHREWQDSPEQKAAYIPNDAFDNGNVYNVLKDGMNYAWTGTEWDALGGEHRDIEAREQIKALSNTLEEQTGDIESALDSIIEIQNSLIGGDSV